MNVLEIVALVVFGPPLLAIAGIVALIVLGAVASFWVEVLYLLGLTKIKPVSYYRLHK